jgi:cell division initiation protein
MVKYMPLMPIDIHNKQFSRGFRGYSDVEVDEFLDQIIKEFEIMLREKKELKAKLENVEDKPKHYTSIDETINKSLVLAQSTSDRVRSDAEKEATRIVQDAEKEAERIVNGALEKSQKIESEIADLRNYANIFHSRFKLLISSQLTMLENNDWEELLGDIKEEK